MEYQHGLYIGLIRPLKWLLENASREEFPNGNGVKFLNAAVSQGDTYLVFTIYKVTATETTL